MRLKISTLLLLLIFSKITIAQNITSLTVNLSSLKKDSLHNITMQLYLLPDTSLSASQVYKAGVGRFSVNKFSKYIVRVSSVGFESTEKMVTIADRPVVISILVKRKTTDLQNVTVVSKKPLIKQVPDEAMFLFEYLPRK